MPDGCLCLQAGRILDDLLDIDHVEQRERCLRFDLDKDVDVVILAVILIGASTQYGEL